MTTQGCTLAATWRCLVTTVLLLGVAGTSLAVYVPTFFDMDKDGDNLISREEAGYWSALLDNWHVLDANRDGAIDLPEWEAIDIKALTSKK